MKCLALRTAKAITDPCGLTPGASGSSEASLTHTLRMPRTRPKLSAAQRGCSPKGTVEQRWTVITVALFVANERCSAAMLKRFRDGECLFRAGDRDFGFFVVKSGKVEILDESGDVPKTVTIYGPGNFTGDVAHLSGAAALVSAVARGDCEVYEISPGGVREVINLHPALGDTILQAFIARRQLLRESGEFAGVRVIGSRYSSDTSRVRDFLARNRLPFTWLDLEANPDVAQLLKQFGVSEADTP